MDRKGSQTMGQEELLSDWNLLGQGPALSIVQCQAH